MSLTSYRAAPPRVTKAHRLSGCLILDPVVRQMRIAQIVLNIRGIEAS